MAGLNSNAQHEIRFAAASAKCD